MVRIKGRLDWYETLHEMWKEFEGNSNFFRQIVIAQDGGFSEVGSLYTPIRAFYAVLAVVLVFYNVVFILWTGTTSLLDNTFTIQLNREDLTLVSAFLQLVGSARELQPEVLLAFYEFALLALSLARCIFLLAKMIYAKYPVRQWDAVAELFFTHVDQLSTLSAMRMLYSITPSVLMPDLAELVRRTVEQMKDAPLKALWNVVWFVGTRFVCIIVGVDAFLTKLLLATREASPPAALLVRLAFLRQCLGIVRVNDFTRRRILIFIFGGEDGIMEDRDENELLVWQAMFTSKLWEANPWWKSLVVMLTYDDYDFQKLALNEAIQKDTRLNTRSLSKYQLARAATSASPLPVLTRSLELREEPSPQASTTSGQVAVAVVPELGEPRAPNAQSVREVSALKQKAKHAELRAADARLAELCARLEVRRLQDQRAQEVASQWAAARLQQVPTGLRSAAVNPFSP